MINQYFFCFYFPERGSRGRAVPLEVSVLRSPSRWRVSPDGKRQQEEGRRGRSRPHFIIFIYTIKSGTKAYNMADKHQIVRRNHHCNYHCKLSVDGNGSQASKQRQNYSFGRSSKTQFSLQISIAYFYFDYLNTIFGLVSDIFRLYWNLRFLWMRKIIQLL